MEICGRLFDVEGYGKKTLVNEVCDFLIGVRFGFQPNTCSSSGSGAEVEKNRFTAGLRLLQCSIRVFDPLHSH